MIVVTTPTGNIGRSFCLAGRTDQAPRSVLSIHLGATSRCPLARYATSLSAVKLLRDRTWDGQGGLAVHGPADLS